MKKILKIKEEMENTWKVEVAMGRTKSLRYATWKDDGTK